MRQARKAGELTEFSLRGRAIPFRSWRTASGEPLGYGSLSRCCSSKAYAYYQPMPKFRKGEQVEWKWPPGYVTGVVVEYFTETVRKTIKGKLITRHGTEENPAYLLLTKKGVNVLKLESELSAGRPDSLRGKARTPGS